MSGKRDLVGLVADRHQRETLETLLARRRSALGIRGISFDIRTHPARDPGVFKGADRFLASFRDSHRYALVLLDVKFPGSPRSREVIEDGLQQRLDNRGWGARSAVVAIDPELEVWVWSSSPHVERILGLSTNRIRRIGDRQRWWPTEAVKPTEPKQLLRAVLAQTGRPLSSIIFGDLARRVSLRRCNDAAFVKLRDTLREWFGVD